MLRMFLIGFLIMCDLAVAQVSPPTRLRRAQITSFQLTSTNSGTAPFTVGLAFKDGDVAETPVLDITNYQINVTRRWNDGSVKTAIASGMANLTANTPLTVNVSGSGTLPSGTSLTSSDIAAAAPSASV